MPSSAASAAMAWSLRTTRRRVMAYASPGTTSPAVTMSLLPPMLRATAALTYRIHMHFSALLAQCASQFASRNTRELV